jgi:hypothetical protein
MWPVDAVVGENGAFYFAYDEKAKRMERVYAQSAEERSGNTGKLWDIARAVLKEFPGTAIASDQAYREIDVAIDFCEDVPPLPLATAQAIAERFPCRWCRGQGQFHPCQCLVRQRTTNCPCLSGSWVRNSTCRTNRPWPALPIAETAPMTRPCMPVSRSALASPTSARWPT